MSDDFIERLRREAAEKAKKAQEPPAWLIERQKQDEQRKRNRVLGMQYFKESGCQACCEKLATFLNSQDPQAKASFYEYYNYPDYIAYKVVFSWHAKFYIADRFLGGGGVSSISKSFQDREVWFRVEVRPDWSLAFEEMGNFTRTVTLNEWRTNKQTVENAIESAYRSAANYRFD